MTLEIKLIITAIVAIIIGLFAWGVKYAIDDYSATKQENATLKLSNKELETTVREQERSGSIVLQVAQANGGIKNAINSSTEQIRAELRNLAISDPGIARRADLPVPDAVRERLRKRPTDSEGYPIMQQPTTVDAAHAGAGGK